MKITILLLISIAFPLSKRGEETRPARPHHAVETVNPGYDRTRSGVLIRRIKEPTLANLDYAAYTENVMLADTAAFAIAPPGNIHGMNELHFKGALVKGSLCDRLDDTPLTETEKTGPLSWRALKENLVKWDFEKAMPLIEACNRIEEEKWGNEQAFRPVQEIAALFIHKPGQGGPEIWVKIEFKPWAKLFDFIDDEDRDGFQEAYGQVGKNAYETGVMDHILNEYVSTVLSKEQVIDWANELASFWYPTYNTDIYHSRYRTWPDPETEAGIKKELGGLEIQTPLVIIKGKPFGRPIYNLFIIDGMERDLDTAAAGQDRPAEGTRAKDETSERAIMTGMKVLQGDLDKYGSGDYQAWAGRLTAFRQGVQARLEREPGKIMGIEGEDGFIFFRKSLEYAVCGDIQAQPQGKDPFPAILAVKKRLDSLNIDFLFVPIPAKPEIYPGKAVKSLPEDIGPYVNPFGRKFVHDLSKAGVEVVDLLPLFIAARDQTGPRDEPVYQEQDTHWTARGITVAADAIAARIRQYGWYAGTGKIKYTVKETEFTRSGDIVSRLEPSRQSRYKPSRLKGRQVVGPDGKLYQDEKTGPTLVMGDSFCGVYQRTDCKHAGISAHIAEKTGVPVNLIMSYGGGPTIIRKLNKGGGSALKGKRLVVWMTAARDLWQYWGEWRAE